MKRLDVVLVRTLQFCVFVLFTFLVLAYFGTLLLLPLSVLVQLTRILTLMGIPDIISVMVALPVVPYVGYQIYKVPGLPKMMLDIGVELITRGQARVKGFDEIVASL